MIQLYIRVCVRTYIHIYTCIYFFKFSSHLDYYRILSRVPCAEWKDPCWLSILNSNVYSQSQTPSPSLPAILNPPNTHPVSHMCVLYESLFYKQVHLYDFLKKILHISDIISYLSLSELPTTQP